MEALPQYSSASRRQTAAQAAGSQVARPPPATAPRPHAGMRGREEYAARQQEWRRQPSFYTKYTQNCSASPSQLRPTGQCLHGEKIIRNILMERGEKEAQGKEAAYQNSCRHRTANRRKGVKTKAFAKCGMPPPRYKPFPPPSKQLGE